MENIEKINMEFSYPAIYSILGGIPKIEKENSNFCTTMWTFEIVQCGYNQHVHPEMTGEAQHATFTQNILFAF